MLSFVGFGLSCNDKISTMKRRTNCELGTEFFSRFIGFYGFVIVLFLNEFFNVLFVKALRAMFKQTSNFAVREHVLKTWEIFIDSSYFLS